MNDTDILTSLESAAVSGNIISNKHSPYDLANPRPRDRTVVSYDVADNVKQLFQSRQYDTVAYDNTAYPQSPIFLEIRPTDPQFNVPASGVAAWSTTPTSVCDVLIAVSGQSQGWHLYGGVRSELAQFFIDGKLTNKRVLQNRQVQKDKQKQKNRNQRKNQRAQKKRRY